MGRRYAWPGGRGSGLWHVDAGPWADDWHVRRTKCGLRFAIMGWGMPVDRNWPKCKECLK